MSGFFAEQTETIDLGDGNTATLRKLNYGQLVEALDDPRSAKRFGVVLAERSLMRWEGAGFEGREATPENFRQLPPAIVKKLVDAADRLNSLPDADVN